MPYQALMGIENNAINLLAARFTALNLGCEHLIDHDQIQNASRILWCLWDGLASNLKNEEKALKTILVEFHAAVRRLTKELK